MFACLLQAKDAYDSSARWVAIDLELLCESSCHAWTYMESLVFKSKSALLKTLNSVLKYVQG